LYAFATAREDTVLMAANLPLKHKEMEIKAGKRK